MPSRQEIAAGRREVLQHAGVLQDEGGLREVAASRAAASICGQNTCRSKEKP